MAGNNTLKFSKGFNLPFDADKALDEFSFVSLQNGQQKVTLAKSDLATTSGTVSIQNGNTKLFSTAANSAGTVSYRSGGTQYFATPTADSSQQVTVGTKGGAGTISIKQTAATTNQTLANKLSNWTTMQWVELAGLAAAGVLLFYLVKGK